MWEWDERAGRGPSRARAKQQRRRQVSLQQAAANRPPHLHRTRPVLFYLGTIWKSERSAAMETTTAEHNKNRQLWHHANAAQSKPKKKTQAVTLLMMCRHR
jgi:hypothetical protein